MLVGVKGLKQNLVHLDRFMHSSQKVVAVTLNEL